MPVVTVQAHTGSLVLFLSVCNVKKRGMRCGSTPSQRRCLPLRRTAATCLVQAIIYLFFIHRQGEVIIWIHHPSPWLVLLDSNDYNYYMVWEPPPAVQLTHSVNTQLTRYRNGTGIHRVTPTGDHTHWVSSSVVTLLWELWKLKEKIRSSLPPPCPPSPFPSLSLGLCMHETWVSQWKCGRNLSLRSQLGIFIWKIKNTAWFCQEEQFLNQLIKQQQ